MAQDEWATIYKSIKDSFGEKFVIEDEKMAIFDLALAAIALDLQAVKNLFSKDQAERIEKWVLKCVDTEDWGEYSIDEVKKYGEKFQTEIQNVKTGNDPIGAISNRLLHRWMGEDIKNFDVGINEKKTGIVDPVLLMMVSNILVAFSGTWKRSKEKFRIVESDLPLDEDVSGLKEHIKKNG